MANYGNRTIALLGDDMQWVQYNIKPEELIGKVSITIRTGSSMPMNKAVEASKAFEVWQTGLLGDPNDPSVRAWTLNQMDLGNIELITQINSKQINYARKEFAVAMEQAKQMPPMPQGLNEDQMNAWILPFVYVPPVTPIDNHHAHIEEHKMDILGSQMEVMASGNAAVQSVHQAMKMHLMDHINLIQMQQQAQQQAAMEAEAYTKGNTKDQILAKQFADILKVQMEGLKAEMEDKTKRLTAGRSSN
jgi:hypothetical protein